MKKIEFMFLALSVLFVSCSSPELSRFMGLKGEVESVRDNQYDVVEKFGEAEADDLDEVRRYVFDSEGRLVQEGAYGEDGTGIWQCKYVYRGREMIWSEFDYWDGTEVSELVESKGDRRIWEKKKGDNVSRFEMVLSERYSCTTSTQEGKVLKTEKWADERGNLVEQKEMKGDEVVYWIKSEYDRGALVRQTFVEGYQQGTVMTYTYDGYDKVGNWTKQMIFRDGKPEYIVIREINYKK